MTTPTTKPPPMTTFFAVEMMTTVTPHQIAGMFCEAAKKAKTLFFGLESLGIIEVNATKFMRFRSDVADPLAGLRALQERGHGVVYRSTEGFVFQRGERTGKVSTSLMVGSPVRNPMTWRGPKVKLWERQFMATP